VERVLAELARDSNVNMAIVTTSTRAHFDLIHRKRNLLRFMDFVLTREDYVSSKPDPNYLLAQPLWRERGPVPVVEDRGADCKQQSPLALTAPGLQCVYCESRSAQLLVRSYTICQGSLMIEGTKT
jgi:hypothetical protein